MERRTVLVVDADAATTALTASCRSRLTLLGSWSRSTPWRFALRKASPGLLMRRCRSSP